VAIVRDVLWFELFDLLGKQAYVFPGGKRDDFESFWVSAYHVQRLPPDGAGGTENGEPFLSGGHIHLLIIQQMGDAVTMARRDASKGGELIK
jgi:hypothetical protein